MEMPAELPAEQPEAAVMTSVRLVVPEGPAVKVTVWPDTDGLAEELTVVVVLPMLTTTLLGLLIAIPTLVAWSYYTKKVETFAVEMESLSDEFLRKHYRNEETATLELAEAKQA